MQEQIQTPARGIGVRLRRVRERQGHSLQDASRVTCISIVYLSALERGASLNAFPAPVYARGFLREYARYLGLDPDPLVDRFWAGEDVPDPVTAASDALAAGGPGRPRRAVPGLRLRTR